MRFVTRPLVPHGLSSETVMGRSGLTGALVRARLGHETLKAAPTGNIIPSQSGFPLVGVTGFEPATSSSRTMRATKLRHTPNGPDWVRADRKSSPSSPGQPFETGLRVRSVTSGGHANRYGAKGELPTPADTCSQEVRSPTRCRLRPFA